MVTTIVIIIVIYHEQGRDHNHVHNDGNDSANTCQTSIMSRKLGVWPSFRCTPCRVVSKFLAAQPQETASAYHHMQVCATFEEDMLPSNAKSATCLPFQATGLPSPCS